MDIFKGLTEYERDSILNCSVVVKCQPDKVLFQENDLADSMYIILNGNIEIYRVENGEKNIISRLGSGDVFGEMGLFLHSKKRTASAIVTSPSLLLKIPENPADLFREIDVLGPAITIMQNLLCLLAQKLREKDEERLDDLERKSVCLNDYCAEAMDSINVIEESLPRGIIKSFIVNRTLEPGEFLCWEGDESKSFYFIHKGRLELLKIDPDKAFRKLGYIVGPTIAGELGFFSGEKRSLCLRAVEEVNYTLFSGTDFKKLKNKDPEQALNVIFAAAQMVIFLILKVENSREK